MIRSKVGIADVSGGEQRDDIRRMLVEYRRELLNEIQSKIRDVREEGSGMRRPTTSLGETTEAEPEDDLAFAFIQIKAEVLDRINEAVCRLDEGTYGRCVDCAEVIATSRLRALPFAVRCRDCEEMREHSKRRERIHAHRVSSALGFDSRH